VPEDGLAGVVAAALRTCIVADGSPVRLIRENDIYHVTHMVTTAVRAHLAATDREREAAALEAAADDHLPPLNCELRYDGTEDPETARWVAACFEFDRYLRDRAAALRADDGSGTTSDVGQEEPNRLE
jgi:hypothetical protein